MEVQGMIKLLTTRCIVNGEVWAKSQSPIFFANFTIE
jgi:hypothetical protein